MSERSTIRKAIHSGSFTDSRWYERRMLPTSLFLKDKVRPALAGAFASVLYGDGSLSVEQVQHISNGFKAMAFGKNNCPFGMEVDLQHKVLLVNDPERPINAHMVERIHPKEVKGAIRVVEAFPQHSLLGERNIRGFIKFVANMQDKAHKPILLYGALDSPVIVFAIETGKQNEMAFANDYYKYRFYTQYYLSKFIHAFFAPGQKKPAS